jgi:hypothetical protein
MLTQIQTTEPQAVIPAAYPRPRAVVFAAVASMSAAWPCSAPAAAPRRLSSVESVRPLGFAGVERSAGPARVERHFGNGATGVLADAASGRAVEGTEAALSSTTGFNQQDKQDKHHSTARRELVTWRPPH